MKVTTHFNRAVGELLRCQFVEQLTQGEGRRGHGGCLHVSQSDLFFGALQLPQAERHQQGQQQQRKQGEPPFEVESQSIHKDAVLERPFTGAPVYWQAVSKTGFFVLKVFIAIVMLLLVLSLVSSAYFLMIDQGDRTKRRTLHSLGVRLTLAVCLMGLIIYGVATGQLGHRNPWDGGPHGAAEGNQ